ncbi:MAG TPA: hypothetical protein VKA27_11855, partial [Sunxiuqinia sp.]|nr:hypothetical protein [Sunxiuqinia sp.]
DHLITELLEPDVILPAVSQGAVAIELREDDEATQQLLDAITDDETWTTTMAERALLRQLEGGCQVPIGCISTLKGDQYTLTAMVASVDGCQKILKTVETNLEEASEKAIELAQAILDEGGKEILDNIRPE